jgi:hypothetical protein
VTNNLRTARNNSPRYVLVEGLFDEESPDSPTRIVAFSSNMHRTLMSAQSCLLGLCPGASVAFIVDEDGAAVKLQQELSRGCIRICMSMSDYTPLLHGYKHNPAYSRLKQAALENGRFREWGADEAYSSVVNKLWEMTAFDGMSPELPMHERLWNLQVTT